MIRSIITAAALLCAAPVAAHNVDQALFAKTIELCQIGLVQHAKGDETYIQRLIARMSQEDQTYIFITCAAYYKGLNDGAAAMRVRT